MTLFFIVIGYNIRICLNDRELLVTSWGDNLSFAYDFQRHKQEETQVKLASLALQDKLQDKL